MHCWLAILHVVYTAASSSAFGIVEWEHRESQGAERAIRSTGSHKESKGAHGVIKSTGSRRE